MRPSAIRAANQSGSVGGPFRPNSDGKREQIAAAALDVLLAEGVFGATTRKIADAAGVSVATLHYHYRDKEEILVSVMENFVRTYRAALADRFPPTQTLMERIEAMVHFICGEIRKGPPEQLLLQEMTIYMLRHPQQAPLARAKDIHFQSLYLEALSRVAGPAPAVQARLPRLSNLIYTGLVGMFHQWLATRDDELFDRAACDLVSSAQSFARSHVLMDLSDGQQGPGPEV